MCDDESRIHQTEAGKARPADLVATPSWSRSRRDEREICLIGRRPDRWSVTVKTSCEK